MTGQRRRNRIVSSVRSFCVLVFLFSGLFALLYPTIRADAAGADTRVANMIDSGIPGERYDETPEPGVITDPGGSVKGLPSGLTIVDSDGHSVPEDGIYYFHVEEMNPRETFTKTISVMNLRDDGKAYHIYFYMEPVSNRDDGIDLLKNCHQELRLNEDVFYHGNVWGEGTDGFEDITKEKPYDLGLYKVGDTKTFTCDITWNGTIGSPDKETEVDKGYRIIDRSNYDDPEKQWVRRPEEDATAYGEVLFHWVFYAEVQEETSTEETTEPGTERSTSTQGDPVKTGDSTPLVLIICIMACSLVIIVLIVLIMIKGRKKEGSSKDLSADPTDEEDDSSFHSE